MRAVQNVFLLGRYTYCEFGLDASNNAVVLTLFLTYSAQEL
jgi:hypothetical protein